MNESVRVREMPMAEIRKLLRTRGGEIGTLAKNNDKLAQAVMAAYQFLYDHPGDHQAGQNLRSAIEDYMNRELRVSEVLDLGSRLGHRLPEPEKLTGERIVVPASILKQ